MHDSASVQMCYLKFVAWFNMFQAENHCYYISGWGLEKNELPSEQKNFMTVNLFPVQLLAYQVSMVCAANWPS